MLNKYKSFTYKNKTPSKIWNENCFILVRYFSIAKINLIVLSGGYMSNLKTGVDVLFVLLGAIMVLAMHAGFAFLELGTVREKNQVNALVKILLDFCVSTLAYFFIGYSVAYGISFFGDVPSLLTDSGFALVKFFFLLTFTFFFSFFTTFSTLESGLLLSYTVHELSYSVGFSHQLVIYLTGLDIGPYIMG